MGAVRKVDLQWFDAYVLVKFGSRARLAAALKNSRGTTMDTSSLSKILDGSRELAITEAVQIADLFGVTLSEVLSRLGYRLARKG